MRAIRRISAVIYLLAAGCVLGVSTCRMLGVSLGRLDGMLERQPGRIALLVLTAIVALGVLITVIRAFAERPDPICVHPAGNPDIEVTLAALTSTAKRAAAGSDDVMIESVEGKIGGRGRDEVRLTIEAIAFTEEGLEPLADRMRQRVVDACERMLGTSGVTARVRFLPSKTTIVTKEV